MAFKKVFELPDGSTAEYIKFRRIEDFDVDEKRCTIIFAIYRDKEKRDAGKVPANVFACRLRLQGEKFEQYFSTAKLKAAAEEGKDLIAIAYEAAKAENVDMWHGSRKHLEDAGDV
jgi:hypothetical protein